VKPTPAKSTPSPVKIVSIPVPNKPAPVSKPKEDTEEVVGITGYKISVDKLDIDDPTIKHD